MGGRARGGAGQVSRTRSAFVGVALVALALGAAVPASAGGGAAATLLEDDFESAIKAVVPATVFCVAPKDKGLSPGSSGVLISKEGHVLSDGDAGAYFKPKTGPDGRPLLGPDGSPQDERAHSDVVEVRIPDLKRGTYAVHLARVVKRVPEIDSTLLKLEKPPTSGLPYVVPGTSADVEVGQFTFAVGTSFPQGEGDAASSLTAGVVASLSPLAPGDAGGRWGELFTSAAVNPGVNGGPLVDAEGTLVGIISTWGEPTAENPFQFLGKAYPIDRIRNAYRDAPGFAAAFPERKGPAGARTKQAERIERALAASARKVKPSVVSLSVKRSAPVTTTVGTPRGPAQLPRYQGPTSGVVVSADGWVVASLYAFADVLALAQPGSPNNIASEVGQVTEVVAHFPDGPSVPAKLVAHDQRLGLVLFKADVPAGFFATPAEVAPAGSLRVGRLVLCVANPFGEARRPSPLLTIGMLSRVHPADAAEAWAGCFQTDAGMTDGTVGGALVDVRGRLLGLATLWNPAGQGRNSGIGYGVPWDRIEAALPSLKAGTSVRYNTAWMGVEFGNAEGKPPLAGVMPDSPAERAGLKVGDRVAAVDGKPVESLGDVLRVVRAKVPGDHLKLSVIRGDRTIEVDLVLAPRPAPPGAAPDAGKPTTPGGGKKPEDAKKPDGEKKPEAPSAPPDAGMAP